MKNKKIILKTLVLTIIMFSVFITMINTGVFLDENATISIISHSKIVNGIGDKTAEKVYLILRDNHYYRITPKVIVSIWITLLLYSILLITIVVDLKKFHRQENDAHTSLIMKLYKNTITKIKST